jgi:hypothetical protein
MTIGAAAWLIALHGTVGMLEYNPGVRLILILILAGAAATLILAAFSRPGRRLFRTIKAAWWAVTAGSLLSFIAIVCFFGFAPFMPAGDKPPALILTTPAARNPWPEITLSYWTEANRRDTVRWGGEGRAESSTDPAPVQRHMFRFANLNPGGRYWYRINEGDKLEFKMPPSGPPLRVAIGSDPHYGVSTSRPDLTHRMLEQIKGGGYDIFLHLGDIAHYGWMDSTWQAGMTELTSLGTRMPLRLAAGNHDTMLGGWDRYQLYWNPTAPDPAWTRLDFGKVHFIMLDLEWLSEEMTPQQLAWLESELADIPRQDWCFAVAHGFVYSSGLNSIGQLIADNADLIRTLSPVFEKYDVDALFSGHAHQLEWLQAGGVDYFICGAFGGLPDEQRTYTSPASRWYDYGLYAYLDLNVEKDKATVIFRDPDNQPIRTITLKP